MYKVAYRRDNGVQGYQLHSGQFLLHGLDGQEIPWEDLRPGRRILFFDQYVTVIEIEKRTDPVTTREGWKELLSLKPASVANRMQWIWDHGTPVAPLVPAN